jgi:hypothetical protein
VQLALQTQLSDLKAEYKLECEDFKAAKQEARELKLENLYQKGIIMEVHLSVCVSFGHFSVCWQLEHEVRESRKKKQKTEHKHEESKEEKMDIVQPPPPAPM